MESKRMNDYRYKRLKGHQPTRLIALQPARDYSADLKCDVIHVDLFEDRNPHHGYMALSYAWGHPDMTHTLRCGRSKIKITANLDTALRSLRSTSGNLLLWVDAVCINQADVAEKSMQLPNMIWIYSKASCVLIFLGADDDGDDDGGGECLAFLRELGTEIDPAADPAWNRVHPAGMEDTISDIQERLFGRPSWDLLQKFFLRNWFSRRWIIQEAAVAVNSLVVCGQTRITWGDFMAGVRVLLRRCTLRSNVDRDVLEALDRIDSVRINWILRSGGIPDVGVFNILTLLQWFNRFDCQNDRDRLFSLLGITGVVPSEFRLLDHVKELMDYSRATADIYTRFATQYLSDSDGYSILNCAGAFHQSLEGAFDIPSWIPDWRARAKFKPLLTSYFKAGLDPPYHSAPIKIEGNRLTAAGLAVDMVKSQLGPRNSSLEPEDVLDFMLQCQEMLPGYHDNSPGVAYAFGKTLVAGHAFAGFEVDPGELEDGELPMEGFFEIASAPNQETWADELQDLCRTRSFADLMWSKKAHGYFQMASNAMDGRAFFRTYQGIFGIAPDGIQQGDMVAILYGTRTPFILRRVDDKWVLIGDAYIHGLMDGEALDPDEFEFTIPHEFIIV